MDRIGSDGSGLQGARIGSGAHLAVILIAAHDVAEGEETPEKSSISMNKPMTCLLSSTRSPAPPRLPPDAILIFFAPLTIEPNC